MARDATVRRRGQLKRQRRLLTRLAVSLDTLLRLKLRIPLRAGLGHSLPVPPARARWLLQELAAGQLPLERLVDAAAGEEEPVSSPESPL